MKFLLRAMLAHKNMISKFLFKSLVEILVMLMWKITVFYFSSILVRFLNIIRNVFGRIIFPHELFNFILETPNC